MKNTLHLTLTYYWYDEIVSGRKNIEYRAITNRWQKMILNKNIKKVIFHRGYTSTTLEKHVSFVDIGPCPYDNWPGDYIRIHFKSP